MAWGGLQALKSLKALFVPRSLVLPSPLCANPLRALPWARSILGRVAEVILNGLVFGVPVRCYPKRAVKGGLFGIWRKVILARSLNFVAEFISALC